MSSSRTGSSKCGRCAIRVTVFRDGSKLRPREVAKLPDAEIIQLMIGRPLKEYMHKARAQIGDVALKVEGLTLPGVFNDISFEVRKGEIVGLGGLVGAGRTDVARAIFGVARRQAGTVSINGKAVSDHRSNAGDCSGAGLRAGGPRGGGDFPHAGGRRRISRPSCPSRLRRAGMIRRSVEKVLANDSVKKLRIRLASLRQPVGELSGGNQQKAILALWLLTGPQRTHSR